MSSKQINNFFKKLNIKPQNQPKYKNPEDFGRQLATNKKQEGSIWIQSNTGSASIINDN